MRIIFCNNCKRKKYLKDETENSIQSCPRCKSTFINIYENKEEVNKENIDKLNESEEVKGGKKMAKETITDVRIANAKKVLEFIGTLNVEDKEVTKILNRAYNIFKSSKASN